MTVTLYISPPATGKTGLVIERIRSLLKDYPLASVWAIVPDRLQAKAFRERLARAGGAMGALVGTFGDVYIEVLNRAGKTIPIASDPTLHRLINGIVEELAGQGKLPYYSSLRLVPGFPRALRERFAELKRALIWPDSFVVQTREDEPGIIELAELYQAYQARLQQIHWADPEGLSWLAVEALEAQPDLVHDWKLLIVDGFDDFNQTQRRALQLLSQQVPEILITLPGSLDMARPVETRFKQAFNDLGKDLNLEVRTLLSSPRLPDPLRSLENQLLANNPIKNPHNSHLFMIEAQTEAEEAREALRWIKAQIIRGHFKPSDCAIFTPEPASYSPLLREAAHEFGLPVRFTQGEFLADTPAIRALLDFLKLPVLDYPRRLTLDGVRSPFFDLSVMQLSKSDSWLLESASSYGQVVGGKDQWLSTLDVLTGLQEDELISDLAEDGQAQPHIPKSTEAARLSVGLHSLMERLSAPVAKSTHQWIAWLEDLMEEIHFVDQCEQVLLENLREVLRSLVVGEMVAGSHDYTYAQFMAHLQSVLEGSCYYPDTSWSKPAVLVGHILEARGVRFKAVAILGLSEGIFPTVEHPDALLDENLRARFGLEPQIGRHQASIFYQAVTRADQCLLLTRPYLAEGGEAWEPSHYWLAVQGIFPESIERIKPNGPRSLLQAASREEALFWALRQDVSPKSDPELMGRAQLVEEARQVLSSRLSPQAHGPYDGFPVTIVPALARKYPDEHIWSCSRLESYGSCPYMFFVGNILELEARQPPELGFDSRQLGSMLHAILEGAYRQAKDRSNLQSVLESLREVAVGEFNQAPQKYGFRPTPLWESQKEHLTSNLEKTVIELDKVSQGWTPVAFEQAFGIESPTARFHSHPLEIETAIGKVRLHGFIDRLDRNDRSQYRVVDYKTGSRHLSKNDLIEGNRFQLPLYALAVQDALQVGPVVDGLYWSINASKAYLELSKFKHEDVQGVQAAAQLATQHIGRIVSGIREADFPPEPPKDGCPAYCAAAAWCWRYTPGFTP